MLEKLKRLIDEPNYPYFDDSELQAYLDEAGKSPDLYALARNLCQIKSGIEEIKLGDIIIPSPRKHFQGLVAQYRGNHGGMVVRADGR